MLEMNPLHNIVCRHQFVSGYAVLKDLKEAVGETVILEALTEMRADFATDWRTWHVGSGHHHASVARDFAERCMGLDEGRPTLKHEMFIHHADKNARRIILSATETGIKKLVQYATIEPYDVKDKYEVIVSGCYDWNEVLAYIKKHY